MHITPELQLALQASIDTISHLARSFFDQRQQTDGMIYQITLISGSAIKFSYELYIIYLIAFI